MHNSAAAATSAATAATGPYVIAAAGPCGIAATTGSADFASIRAGGPPNTGPDHLTAPRLPQLLHVPTGADVRLEFAEQALEPRLAAHERCRELYQKGWVQC